MKVEGPDLTGRLKDILQKIRSEEDKTEQTDRAREAESGSGAADRIDLSPRARELRLLTESLERKPEMRRALVDALREEIRTGRYTPDGRIVAEGLLREVEDGESDGDA